MAILNMMVMMVVLVLTAADGDGDPPPRIAALPPPPTFVPPPENLPKLLSRFIEIGGTHLKNATAKGNSASATNVAVDRTNVPGGSITSLAFNTGASTPHGEEVASSAILGVAEARSGIGGISATISETKGGSNANRKDGAKSNGKALLGAIAIKDGTISTTTVIADTKADSRKGSQTESLGFTRSTGPDGEAFGIQQTLSTAGASDDTSTQAEQRIGSSVGDVGTRVILAAGSRAVKNPTTTKPPQVIPRLSLIEQAVADHEAAKEAAGVNDDPQGSGIPGAGAGAPGADVTDPAAATQAPPAGQEDYKKQ